MPGIEEFDQLFTPSFISKRKREGEGRKEGESESESERETLVLGARSNWT